MVYEDFTTYTEVDPGGHLAVIANKITATAMPYSAECWVKKDYGVNYFGDFDHEHKITVTVSEPYCFAVFWLLTDNDATRTETEASANADSMLVNVKTIAGGNLQIWFRSYEPGGTYDSYEPGGSTGTFYLITKRVGTTGTCEIYSDAARSNLIDTLTITAPASQYQYLIATSSKESTGTEAISCTSEDLDLAPIREIGATIYFFDGANNIELQRDDSSPVQMFNGVEVIGLKLGIINDPNASPLHVFDGTNIKAILKMS